MKWRAVLPAAAVYLLAVSTDLAAQQQAPLALDDAIELAKRTSPTYLRSLNSLAPANWNVRQANARLYLPSANVNLFGSWQDAGEQRLGAATFAQPSVLLSQYSLNVNYRLDGTTLFSPGLRKSERSAVENRIDNADLSLRTQVTSAYLEVLRLDAQAEQAERELTRSQEHLRLAEARQEVGAGTRLESMQADVTRGQAQVALLVANNAARVAKLRLVEALGVQLPPEQIDLVSTFEVFEPNYDIEAFISDALARHPNLLAVKADRQAANSAIKVAKAAYFPTLSLNAAWSGFTREETDPNRTIDRAIGDAQADAATQTATCVELQRLYGAVGIAPPPAASDCSVFDFTSQDSATAANTFTSLNTQFPFAFQNEPVSVSAFIQIPIFNNFDRQAQVEQSVAARNDLDYFLRALELQTRANVAEAVYNLETAYETVVLQGVNTRTAREELRLAQERYQLGAGTFLELLDSQTLTAQAEVDEINAVFAFHQNLAALEASVGHELPTN